MDCTLIRAFLCAWILSAPFAFADIHYVSLNSTNPTNPYTSWSTAATNIQDAIDAATAGDTVLVSNGVYQTGGRITPGGSTSNRVVVDKAITVQSVNGPANTFIRGVLATNATAMRCVYLAPNAFLSGFTLTNGGTRADGDLLLNQSGAGVLGNTGSVVSNCIIDGNWAQFGGGVSQGTVLNSRIAQNYAFVNGGGSFAATLSACEVRDNSAAVWGGGMRSGVASNCLFEGNNVLDGLDTLSRGTAAHNSTLVHCTIVSNLGPVQVVNCTVINSIVHFPIGLVPRNHDPNGNDDSYFTNSCTTPMPPGSGNITNNPQLAGFRLAENSPCIDILTNGFSGATDLDGAPRVVNERADMGAYEFQVRFVSIASTNPIAPFASWTTAATSIQAAVDTAFTGTVIFVSNGLYQTGGRVINGSMTNRVALDKPISLRSINGPDVTIIRGAKDPVTGSNGNAAVRCVYLVNGASISGFTLTNGATRATEGGYPTEQTGGGVFSAAGSVISNCVVAGNHAHADGGGLYSGNVFDSRIFGNTARLGGGLSQSTLNRGVVFTNRAVEGGGLYNCTAYNVILLGNQASSNAGAAELSTLYGATVYGNSANNQGGGIRNTTVGNSIILSNTAPNGPNVAYAGLSSNINHTCTAPQANGTGNITNDPQFVNAAARDFRLKAGSPCINAGNNFTAIGPTDLQRNPRVAENTVDLGAYEYDQALALFDSDGDTWSDAEEFISNTSPTNPALFFREADFAPAPEGQVALVISNTSAARRYGIYQSTNLLAAPQSWSLVSTQFPGNGAALTITLTNPAPNAALRSGVRLP